MSDLRVLTRLWDGLSNELNEATSLADVDRVKKTYLGAKSGRILALNRETDFAAMTPEERQQFGQAVKELRSRAEWVVAEHRQRFAEVVNNGAEIGLDLSMPGDPTEGSVQPVMLVQLALEDIFRGLGFRVDEGFEVETEYFNFDAVNVGRDHPARDMQDTFWLENGLVLRTHTSASQVRALREYGAPLRIIFPGRCFRQEETDASHENSFYQCEGLMVDKYVSVADLLGVMRILLAEVFEREVSVRLRPGYFPFVEPGFELDIGCLICGGNGCQVCKHSGWLELMPCGMVHPKVLEAGGIPDGYMGFAFGLGMTRLAMMKYSIPDIRLFDSGDLRFYSQFPAYV
jgi:phenylalanyl-tRNA synthetase alpha chain